MEPTAIIAKYTGLDLDTLELGSPVAERLIASARTLGSIEGALREATRKMVTLAAKIEGNLDGTDTSSIASAETQALTRVAELVAARQTQIEALQLLASLA